MNDLKKYLLLTLLLATLHIFGQEKYTISGIIYDQSSNETLIGVSIYFPELNSGTSTNEYGFYSITIPAGNHTLSISYLGYTSISETV